MYTHRIHCSGRQINRYCRWYPFQMFSSHELIWAPLQTPTHDKPRALYVHSRSRENRLAAGTHNPIKWLSANSIEAEKWTPVQGRSEKMHNWQAYETRTATTMYKLFFIALSLGHCDAAIVTRTTEGCARVRVFSYACNSLDSWYQTSWIFTPDKVRAQRRLNEEYLKRGEHWLFPALTSRKTGSRLLRRFS